MSDNETKSAFERIYAIEERMFLGRLCGRRPGTVIRRVLGGNDDGNVVLYWSVGIGYISEPKIYITCATVEECLDVIEHEIDALMYVLHDGDTVLACDMEWSGRKPERFAPTFAEMQRD